MSEKYIKIKLEEIEDRKYRIIGFDTDVGIISLSDKAELYFEIKKRLHRQAPCGKRSL